MRSNYVNEVTPRSLHDHSKDAMFSKIKGFDLIDNLVKNDSDF